jgi:hypothetical protein
MQQAPRRGGEYLLHPASLLPMSDTISASTSIAHPSTFPARASTTAERRDVVRGASVLAVLDSLAAVGAIVGVLIGTNLPAVAGSLDGFLSARVTVKNLLLLLLLAIAWPVIFRLFGLYGASSLRTFRIGSAARGGRDRRGHRSRGGRSAHQRQRQLWRGPTCCISGSPRSRAA